MPRASMRWGSTPRWTSANFTASARRSESRSAASTGPVPSVNPSIAMLRSGCLRRNCASVSSVRSDPARSVVPLSNRRSSLAVRTQPRSVCSRARQWTRVAAPPPRTPRRRRSRGRALLFLPRAEWRAPRPPGVPFPPAPRVRARLPEGACCAPRVRQRGRVGPGAPARCLARCAPSGRRCRHCARRARRTRPWRPAPPRRGRWPRAELGLRMALDQWIGRGALVARSRLLEPLIGDRRDGAAAGGERGCEHRELDRLVHRALLSSCRARCTRVFRHRPCESRVGFSPQGKQTRILVLAVLHRNFRACERGLCIRELGGGGRLGHRLRLGHHGARRGQLGLRWIAGSARRERGEREER